MTREDVGPVLIANSQPVRESSGGHQEDRLALSFQQGIGCDRGADFDRVYGLCGSCENVACPPDSGVYNQPQAEKAWSRLLVLYGKALA